MIFLSNLFFFGQEQSDVDIRFVMSYPMESTLLMVCMYVVTASSRSASIVLLKLRALKQQDRDLVMTVWINCQIFGDHCVSVFSSPTVCCYQSHVGGYKLTLMWGRAAKLSVFSI